MGNGAPQNFETGSRSPGDSYPDNGRCVLSPSSTAHALAHVGSAISLGHLLSNAQIAAGCALVAFHERSAGVP